MRQAKLFIVLLFTGFLSISGINNTYAKGNKLIYKQMKNGKTFVAELSGKNEVPSINTKATGKAIISFSKDGKELHYKISVSNIDSVFAAHIHIGSSKENGPIAVVLYNGKTTGAVNGILVEGTITSKNLIGPMEGKKIKDLEASVEKGNTYINVHTEMNQSGEIRGQLHKK